MHNIVELLRTVDGDQLLREEIEAAADEIERLQTENEKLIKALAVYRGRIWPVTEDGEKTPTGDGQYLSDHPQQAAGRL